MKKKFFTFILSSIFLINICYGQSGWFLLNNGVSVDLAAIHFFNNNTGFAFGGNYGQYSVIYKTTNEGQNWILNYSIPGEIYYSCSFVSDSLGWIGGNSSSTGSGVVYKTTNQGFNWVKQTLLAPLSVLYFVDQDYGWTYGNGFLCYTTNGGSQWNKRNINSTINFASDMHFINRSTGYINATAPRGLFKSTNGGINWFNASSYNVYINSIFFVDSSLIFGCGPILSGTGTIIKSTDSGFNWTNVYTNAYRSLSKIYMLNANTGYAVGNIGFIVKTTNGGINWGIQASNTFSYLRSIQMLNENTGWITGDTGVILHTTDGGGNYINNILNIEGTQPVSYSLSQNYPNPFNPNTKIKFAIPKLSDVKLIIYDILGREVATLVNEQLKPGTYEADWDGRSFASGVYFYKLISGDYIETKRMVLLK